LLVATVQVKGASRALVPTQLGVALVHGYLKIDASLVLPDSRARLEQRLAHIAKGSAQFTAVVRLEGESRASMVCAVRPPSVFSR
jgi:DNA topoisomerase IA